MTLSDQHRQQIHKRGFNDEQINWMVAQGFLRSLTWEEVEADWLDIFGRARETETGGILICFNPKAKAPTYSLRCDSPPWDAERERHAKYLYPKGSEDPVTGDRLNPDAEVATKTGACQPFDPSNLEGPDGNPIGLAKIATEGFFDAMACTLLAGIPCIGLTAPGHLYGSGLPRWCKGYIGDCDTGIAPNLLGTVIGQARRRGLKLQILPFRQGHNYAVTRHRDLHADAKAGMEELITDLGPVAAAKVIADLSENLLDPVEFLEEEFSRWHQELHLAWPDHRVILNNGASAIADASPSNKLNRGALRDVLGAKPNGLGVPKREINARIEQRLSKVEAQIRADLLVTTSNDIDGHLVVEPEIDKSAPTLLMLQQFLNFKHQIRFNELDRVIEVDGNMVEKPHLAHQLLAHVHQMETTRSDAMSAIEYLANGNPFNPIREYLLGLVDRPDLELVTSDELADAFGFDRDDDLSIELMWRQLGGAVNRGITPGAQHDTLLVLSGAQGFLKSSSIAALVPTRRWVDAACNVGDLEAKDFLSRINSAWLFEIAELEKMTISRSASEFKAWLTFHEDKYVEKHEKVAIRHPRRSVMFGTTNEDEVLTDPTGARRFWVCLVEREAKPQWIAANRDGIWRTVMTLLANGMRTYFPESHPRSGAIRTRALGATIAEPWEVKVADTLEAARSLGETFVSSDLLLERIGVPLDRQERADTMKLSRAIKAAVGKAWKPRRRTDPTTKILKRGYEWVGNAGNQPQTDSPTSDQGWQEGWQDLSPLAARVLKPDAILTNLFL
ncbi:virulence-associated E family protein [Synechococcus sp. A10-1-5-1]|uniref:virulence-associated E family protein n=1 Tax=Synechococcus sp. A10-1-5-1 TaxID=2936507 RepID=UPI002000B1C9|nr:virulence-associated E family protein [Synechococcus sp. A10-1-5-1]UPM50136.1 virulence-associated E family protein [Synechococcus sp. A10-1-5-1]